MRSTGGIMMDHIFKLAMPVGVGCVGIISEHLRAGKTYGKPIFGVGFDLIKNLRENLFKNL